MKKIMNQIEKLMDHCFQTRNPSHTTMVRKQSLIDEINRAIRVNEKEKSPIVEFAKMLQKKIPEYLEEVDNSISIAFGDHMRTERQISDGELKSFLRWGIEQTGEYKRLQAERKDLLSKADEVDRQMKQYIEEGWVK